MRRPTSSTTAIAGHIERLSDQESAASTYRPRLPTHPQHSSSTSPAAYPTPLVKPRQMILEPQDLRPSRSLSLANSSGVWDHSALSLKGGLGELVDGPDRGVTMSGYEVVLGPGAERVVLTSMKTDEALDALLEIFNGGGSSPGDG